MCSARARQELPPCFAPFLCIETLAAERELYDEEEVILLLDDLSGYISADLDESNTSDSGPAYTVYVSEPHNLFWRLHPDSEITPHTTEHPYLNTVDEPFFSDYLDARAFATDGDGEPYNPPLPNPHYLPYLHLDLLFDGYPPLQTLLRVLEELHHSLRHEETTLILFQLPPP